jgi:MscS family membrane protein
MSAKYSGRLPICVLLLALWSPVAGAADTGHPLAPLDLSSPRATLINFLTTGDALFQLLREEYQGTPSRAGLDRKLELGAALARTLDLSEIAPAARDEMRANGFIYLYEVLSRIELPPAADIPDAAAYADAGDDKDAGDKPVSWTIPHTEITLVRVADGPHAGEFLFSPSTVARAWEFYKKVRTLPYRRAVPLKNYAEMRHYLSMRGWMIPARAIEGFPGWLKFSVHQQAVWKWIALALLIAVTIVVVVFIHRLARRGLSGHHATAYLRRLATPLTLLLVVPLMQNLAHEQLTLTGSVTGVVASVAEAITYFALAWIAWTGSIAVAEAVIASPKISDESLNAVPGEFLFMPQLASEKVRCSLIPRNNC